mmetsp:Transcript_93979/g.151654  ORF Transcript_93979/g.151654 Transcript_93979/m.151654 type:complete len:101 (-) Transcript_93979:48-350(-)
MGAISCLLTLCYFNSKLFESFRGKLQRFLLKIRHGGGGSPSGARQGRGKVGQQASATVPLARDRALGTRASAASLQRHGQLDNLNVSPPYTQHTPLPSLF